MREFRAESVPRPRGQWDLAFLEREGPLDLEIGCGVGLHPIRRARALPQRNLIAIEHTAERFAKFAGRVRNHKPLPNLWPVHADAVEWVTHFLSPQSVSECFLLYPNPNPKPAHRSRRWHAMPFMRRLLDSLAPGGLLTVATNLEWYARECDEFMTGHWGLERLNPSDSPEGELWRGEPRTHFEKKYLERGESCRNLVFRLKAYSCGPSGMRKPR